ncbi:hypothetical protein EON67_09740 [archaeon]|nr:MAG: hypothetical protein EON67_09740 [archaeon]
MFSQTVESGSFYLMWQPPSRFDLKAVVGQPAHFSQTSNPPKHLFVPPLRAAFQRGRGARPHAQRSRALVPFAELTRPPCAPPSLPSAVSLLWRVAQRWARKRCSQVCAARAPVPPHPLTAAPSSQYVRRAARTLRTRTPGFPAFYASILLSCLRVVVQACTR